jgi:hypothetical protein
MKSGLKWSANLLLVLLLANCKNDDGNKGGSTGPAAPTGPGFSLIDAASTTWESDCILDDSPQRSFKRVFFLGDKSFSYQRTNYEGQTCEPAMMDWVFESYYNNVRFDSTSRLEGWKTIAYNVERITATPKKEVQVMDANQKSNYGYTDWSLDQAKEITGRRFRQDAEPELKAGAARERTFLIEGDVAYFARKDDSGNYVDAKDQPFHKVIAK